VLAKFTKLLKITTNKIRRLKYINFRKLLRLPEDGFGGLVVSILATEFAGSNPAEAVGFFGHPKNPQYVFLRRGSKIICPMSQLCGM
jgi:hypothetical protein